MRDNMIITQWGWHASWHLYALPRMHPCLNQTKASLTVRNDPMEIIFWCALHVWKATIFRPLIPKTVQNCPLRTSVIATSAWLKQDVQKSCAIPQISIGVAKYVNRCSNLSKRSKIEIQTKQLLMAVDTHCCTRTYFGDVLNQSNLDSLLHKTCCHWFSVLVTWHTSGFSPRSPY